MVRILKHGSVQAALAGAGVIAAGLYLTHGAPLAWAIAAVWAALVVVAVAQAAQR
jgi:hypothetical protein